MLLRGNICYIKKGLGVVGEKVFVEYFADAQQEVGVDGRLVEEALHGAALYAQLVGEPLVGVARAAQFVADEVAYVYLHSGCCLCAWLPIPLFAFRRPQTKKKASNLVSNVRS